MGRKVLAIVILLSVILGTEFIVYYFGKASNFQDPQLIVVLGCGNRTENALLNDRLEAAVRAHVAYPHLPILLTGDEKNKLEISSMSRYIRNKIPNAQVLLDPNSLNTWDSFVYIKNNFPNANLLIITNEFHQKRALYFSRLLKLSAKSYGKDLNFKNNWLLFLRERFARLLIYKHLF